MSGVYDDILHFARPQSKKHRPMPMEDRAAQFSPFAALTGYDAAVSETARCTEERIEFDPQEAERLGERLAALIKRQREQPELSLLYFVPDARKAGGAYVTVSGRLKKITDFPRCIYLTDGSRIPIEDIVAVESPGFNEALLDSSDFWE